MPYEPRPAPEQIAQARVRVLDGTWALSRIGWVELPAEADVDAMDEETVRTDARVRRLDSNEAAAAEAVLEEL